MHANAAVTATAAGHSHVRTKPEAIRLKKGAYSSSLNSPQNYETPLVKWDHTVLSAIPDRGGRPAFTPTGQVGTGFIDPIRMKG